VTPLHDYWTEAVNVALLGTDRRPAPPTPVGGLADLIADAAPADDGERLLLGVGACVAVRRAGMLPAPTVTPLQPPPADRRPLTPAAAAHTWHQIITHWPVLEDEWLLAVITNGWRLAHELVDAGLARHRNDAVRHARVRLAAGPLADWLIALQPQCAARSTSVPAAEAVVGLPDLPVSPDLQPLLHAAPGVAASALADAFNSQQLGPPHRAVLTNLVARMLPASLPPVAQALARCDVSLPSIGIAVSLADLARLRHRMLNELTRKDAS
jgi:hypothetical protein